MQATSKWQMQKTAPECRYRMCSLRLVDHCEIQEPGLDGAFGLIHHRLLCSWMKLQQCSAEHSVCSALWTQVERLAYYKHTANFQLAPEILKIPINRHQHIMNVLSRSPPYYSSGASRSSNLKSSLNILCKQCLFLNPISSLYAKRIVGNFLHVWRTENDICLVSW